MFQVNHFPISFLNGSLIDFGQKTLYIDLAGIYFFNVSQIEIYIVKLFFYSSIVRKIT